MQMMVSAKAFPGLIVRWIAAALLAAVWLFPAQALQEKIDQAETGAVIALSEDVTALDGCVPYIQEGAVLTLRDSGEVLPAVVILFALLLVVWPDNYLSRELLMRTVRDNQDTEYGKLYHFDQIRSIDDYKRLVPFSTYDDYAPFIERMVNKGEKNLITTYPIVQYAETSGSIGVPKKIPVSKQTMEIYTKYTITRVTALADRWQREHNHHKLPIGRGFNQLEIVDRTLPDGTPLGNISGSAAKSYNIRSCSRIT